MSNFVLLNCVKNCETEKNEPPHAVHSVVIEVVPRVRFKRLDMSSVVTSCQTTKVVN